MKHILICELRRTFGAVRTYVFLVLTTLAVGLFTAYVNLYGESPAFEYTIEFITLALLLTLPLITISSFASDNKSGYGMMLASLGVPERRTVAAKYLSALSVFIIHFLITAASPVVLSFFVTLNARACLSALFGYLLIGASITAVLVFVSAVSPSPLVSAIASYVTVAIVYASGALRTTVSTSSGASLGVLTAVCALISVALLYSTGSGIFASACAIAGEVAIVVLYSAFPDAMRVFTFDLMTALSPTALYSGFGYGLLDLGSVVALLCYLPVFLLTTVFMREKRRYD